MLPLFCLKYLHQLEESPEGLEGGIFGKLVARAMLHEKMPVETISRLTGLSAEQIRAL